MGSVVKLPNRKIVHENDKYDATKLDIERIGIISVIIKNLKILKVQHKRNNKFWNTLRWFNKRPGETIFIVGLCVFGLNIAHMKHSVETCKLRDSYSEYKECMSNKHYVDWDIKYDEGEGFLLASLLIAVRDLFFWLIIGGYSAGLLKLYLKKTEGLFKNQKELIDDICINVDILKRENQIHKLELSELEKYENTINQVIIDKENIDYEELMLKKLYISQQLKEVIENSYD